MRLVRSLLKDKKARREADLFVAEGVNFVCDLPDKTLIDRVYYTASAARRPEVATLFDEISAPVFEVSDSVMKSMSDTVSPSGVLAVLRIPHPTPSGSSRVLILDGVTDPGNIGTMIRTAAAFGFEDVYAGHEVDFYSPKIVRSTMTGLFSVQPINCDLSCTLPDLASRGYTLIALDMQAPSIRDVHVEGKIAVIVGSEAHGISTLTRSCAHRICSIPMQGNIESLNAAVAAALAMYELSR